jgi:hypothetical protein
MAKLRYDHQQETIGTLVEGPAFSMSQVYQHRSRLSALLGIRFVQMFDNQSYM